LTFLGHCDLPLTCYGSGPVKTEISNISNNSSNTDYNSQEQLGREIGMGISYHGQNQRMKLLGVSPEPFDAIMEDRPISDVDPISTFNDSGFGASQSSRAATAPSPSSVLSKIEENESGCNEVLDLERHLERPFHKNDLLVILNCIEISPPEIKCITHGFMELT
jgi:hypothetical protein